MQIDISAYTRYQKQKYRFTNYEYFYDVRHEYKELNVIVDLCRKNQITFIEI